jgi:tetratricopeptide (TPR) repeat protein
MDTKETLQAAITHHKAGELEDAEQLYRAILNEQANHPDANHNLGVLLKQGDKVDIALPFFKTALESTPNQGQFWISYIDTLIHLEKLDAARSVFEQAQSKGLKGDAVDQLKERLNSKVKPSPESVGTQSKPLNVNAILKQAKSHGKKGQLDEAKQLYHRVLEAFPQNPQAKKGLKALKKGQVNKKKPSRPPQAQIDALISLYSRGYIQEALSASQMLIKDYPNTPLPYNFSGVCYQAFGQLDAAVRSYEQALAIKPDYAEAHYNLGFTLKELGQLEVAVKSFEQALAIKPDYAEAHYNLGNTLKELGQLEAAVKSHEKALAIKPDYAELHYNLGNTLKDLGQLEEVVKSYELALAIKPDYAEAHNNLGNTLNELDQLEAAVKSFKQALAIKPDYAQAHNNLGNTLKDLGQLEVAVKSYEEALAIKPDFAGAHRNLSLVKRYLANDTQITQMESLLLIDDLSQSDRMHLCFALAKAYEDLGKHDDLFQVLHEGNRLRKQALNYSLNQDKNLLSIIRKLFHLPSSTSEHPKSFNPSPIQPIFIVGMPRSGTTLVEQIIASHHEVHGAGELNYLNNIIGPIINDKLTHNTISLSKESYQSIRQHYLDSLAKLNAPEKVITDKMPLNFRYIGYILSAFPEAKIIHLKRDPRATCWSIYKHYFSKGNGFSYNQNDLASFYHLYKDLMIFWHQQFPDKIYDLCYEDLTTNQEEETRQLLNYCDLDWDKNCLNFHTNKRAVKTASALQVRQKIYQGSSEAWRKYEDHLQPLINALKPVS